MKKLIAIISLIFVAYGVSISQAVEISTDSYATGSSPVLFIQDNESFDWTIQGTATGTIRLEASRNGSQWSLIQSVVGTGPVDEGGNVKSDTNHRFFRLNVTTITGGNFSSVLRDANDYVGELKNNKNIPLVEYYDNHIRLKGLNFPPSATIEMTTTKEIKPSDGDQAFIIITSSGGALTAGATPTISTLTATNGDIYFIQSTTATVTFSDNDTVAGTLLELGSTTRALGVGDILAVIYRGGFWYELFIADN